MTSPRQRVCSPQWTTRKPHNLRLRHDKLYVYYYPRRSRHHRRRQFRAGPRRRWTRRRCRRFRAFQRSRALANDPEHPSGHRSYEPPEKTRSKRHSSRARTLRSRRSAGHCSTFAIPSRRISNRALSCGFAPKERFTPQRHDHRRQRNQPKARCRGTFPTDKGHVVSFCQTNPMWRGETMGSYFTGLQRLAQLRPSGCGIRRPSRANSQRPARLLPARRYGPAGMDGLLLVNCRTRLQCVRGGTHVQIAAGIS